MERSGMRGKKVKTNKFWRDFCPQEAKIVTKPDDQNINKLQKTYEKNNINPLNIRI